MLGRMMDSQASIADWLQTPLGVALRNAESEQVSAALARVFGIQFLQVGLWGSQEQFLPHARTARATLIGAEPAAGVAMLSDPASLSIAAASVDAVLLPHTLELHERPHDVVREIGRILAGEGHLITLGFNPYGAFGLRRLLTRGGYPAQVLRYIPERRMRDWLALLGFEVLQVKRFFYRLPISANPLPAAEARLEKTGSRFWPHCSGAYMMVAKKRVYTMTPVRPLRLLNRGVVGGLVEPTTRSAA